LLGRSLDNALAALGLRAVYGEGISGLGFRLEDLLDTERDPGLGNGGLGRLAACYMDSLAACQYPAWGYGLRYTYGIFQQRIVDGYQNEVPDYWLTFDNPWEIPRHDVTYEVRFGGTTRQVTDPGWPDSKRHVWTSSEVIRAMAYDVPIPAMDNKTCINIRLWGSQPRNVFDFGAFSAGEYVKSVEENIRAANITSVLYPNDNHMLGKELRLKQQYFFVCATLQDIVRRFKKSGREWHEFPSQVAVQLNDTHPTLAVVELMQMLLDHEGMTWSTAWGIVTRTFAFTNHTVLPEALETWPVPLMKQMLPRHMEIVFDINLYFLQEVERRAPGDIGLLQRMSIIQEGFPQLVRMANLAIVASHTVNGVAALHSQLIKETIFKDFVWFYGESKFQNKTNGVTPRRWLDQANRELSELITETLGSRDWVLRLDELKKLEAKVDDEDFLRRWIEIKHNNKVRLAKFIRHKVGIRVDADALFDVQVKRIHEYKRQLMNILSVIHRYYLLKQMPAKERQKQVKRCVIFAGKAAPGYYIAKLVIKLINDVADVLNDDPDTRDILQVIFVPDYNVSQAELLVPASDISQHISTAGMEASGTSNMKFVLNGGIILGTVDGANIEIAQQIGDDNIFLFGLTADQVPAARHDTRFGHLPMNEDLKLVMDIIYQGTFGDPAIYSPVLDALTQGGDYYLLSADFAEYLKAQNAVDTAYQDEMAWARKSLLCTARMGFFSSDRAVREYAQDIWGVKPCPVGVTIEDGVDKLSMT
jgi:starch phosphorylase